MPDLRAFLVANRLAETLQVRSGVTPKPGRAEQEPGEEHGDANDDARDDPDKRRHSAHTVALHGAGNVSGNVKTIQHFRKTELRATVLPDPAIPDGVEILPFLRFVVGLSGLRICDRTGV